MLLGHAIAVGHHALHLRNIFVREHKVVRNHFTEVQHESNQGVGFIDREGARCIPWHGAMDIIPKR